MFFRKLKRLIFSLCISLFLILACSRTDKDSDLPEYVLNRKVMIALLTDVHIVEAVLQKKHGMGQLALDLAGVYYDTLFEKYNITRIQIDSSIAFYSRRPDVFEGIYTTVITNLSKKEDEIKIEMEKEKEFEMRFEPEPEKEIIPEDKIEEKPLQRIQKEKII